MSRGPLIAGAAVLAALAMGLFWLRTPAPDPGSPVAGAVAPPGTRHSTEPPPTTLTGPPLRADTPGMKDPGPHGPTGATISLVGRVTGKSEGRTFVECQDRHYMVVKGLDEGGLDAGESIQLGGKLVGTSEDGLFYIEAVP